jgi:hypothetical protein
MTSFFLARGESRSFSFQALAQTEKEARAALCKTLTKHGKQYQISPSWWKDETLIDIYVEKIQLNKGYRDGSAL